MNFNQNIPTPLQETEFRISRHLRKILHLDGEGKMILINRKDEQPPKNESFFALTTARFEMMEWKERVIDGKSEGWFGFYCPCACCSGHCSDHFDLWMRLPQPPKE